MNHNPAWEKSSLSLGALEGVPQPPRSGFSNKGHELLLWAKPYPVWYALLIAPLVVAVAFFIGMKKPEATQHMGALTVLAVVFLVILSALLLFFLFSRIELKVNSSAILFRKSVLGLGKWDSMPLNSITKITLRSQLLTEGISTSESGTPVMEYHRNAGLVIVGRHELDLRQSLTFAQSEHFRALLIAAVQHFRKSA